MEYIEGVDFQQWIRSGGVEPVSAINALCQVCDALHYAHGRGYIHRDIKPANIFLNSQGIIKVCDFGLVRIASSAQPTIGHDPSDPEARERSVISYPGLGMGTPGYSAPEQLEGREVHHRADIYSLGATLYVLLTREVPRGHFALPSEKAAVNPVFDEIVRRAMVSEPGHRCTDVSEMRSELDQARVASEVVTSEVESGDPDEEARETDALDASVRTETRDGAESRSKSSRAPVLLLGGGVALLLAVTGSFFALPGWRKGADEPKEVRVISYREISVVEGSSDDAMIPLASRPEKNTARQSLSVLGRMLKGESISPEQAQEEIFGSQLGMLASGTEVTVIGHFPSGEEAGKGTLGDQVLAMTQVEVMDGPLSGKNGWVPAHLVRTKRVPITE